MGPSRSVSSGRDDCRRARSDLPFWLLAIDSLHVLRHASIRVAGLVRGRSRQDNTAKTRVASDSRQVPSADTGFQPDRLSVVFLLRLVRDSQSVTEIGENMRLEDKVIAITGSGSGLGRDAAKLFSSEGARIVVSDVVTGRAQKVAADITADGGAAIGIDVDVRIESDVQRLVDTAVEEFGRIDVMWANAGVPEPDFGKNLFVDSTLDDWNDIVAVNLTGIYLSFRIAARQMIAQGHGGNLLATTSSAAFVAYPGFPMYSATKAGGNGIVRGAAVELGRHGIRANALCPVHGMSVNFALPPEAEVLGKSYDEMQPWNPEHRAMPLDVGRPPTLRDNSHLALFLVSDDAAYMSGQTIQSVDGGTFARPAIVFPSDRGEDASTSRVLPDEIRDSLTGHA